LTNLGLLFADRVGSARVALVDFPPHAPPRETTYEALDAACNAFARGLVRAGISNGDRIGILTRNRAEFVSAFFGAMRVGAVPVPVNPKLGAEAVAAIFADAGVRLVVTEAASAATCPAALTRIDLDDEATFADHGAFEAVPPSRDDAAFQLYTSGSTGRPKGVVHGHAAQAWCVDAVARARGIREDDRVLTAAPLFHKAGILTLKTTLAGGGTLVLLPGFTLPLYIDCLRRYRPTILTGAPTIYKVVLGGGDVFDDAASALVRAVYVGSAPVSDELSDALSRRFPNAAVMNGYGLTEVGAIFGPHPSGVVRPRGSLGVALPGVALELEGSETEGILRVRSPAIMQRYHGAPEETARRLVDGWFDTGDVCRRDTAGFYYFVRRSDDTFKCGAENVHPREVETILQRHPDIREAAVVAVEHELKGHVPVAFVVLRPGATLDERQVKDWFLSVAAAFQHPRRVLIEKSLPLNGSSKVDYMALRARVSAVKSEPSGKS
jgi:acyl-CoA synthetase (AMP-forming)/AMP-acid ligase II